jgi:hypothetical protein
MKNDINNILENYWKGQSSLDEEQMLRDYLSSDNVSEEHRELMPLFEYFKEEKNLSVGWEPDLSFTKPKPHKIRFLFPKLIAIAASLILLFTVSRTWLNVNDTTYKNKFTELEDPDEALAITLDALGFVGKNYEKGSKPTSHMKQLEKTAVFTYNK